MRDRDEERAITKHDLKRRRELRERVQRAIGKAPRITPAQALGKDPRCAR